MTVSLTFDWLHVLAGIGIIAVIFFVGSFVWSSYRVWLFRRGMRG